MTSTSSGWKRKRTRKQKRTRLTDEKVPKKRACDTKRKHPSTLGELREVEGIGESKAGRLGRELLGMMKLFDGEQPAPQDARAVPTGA